MTGVFNSTGAEIGSLNSKGSTFTTSTKINRSLITRGEFNAKQLTLLGDAQIFGNFFGSDVSAVSSIEIKGSVYCKKCLFASSTGFKGAVKVIDSQFNANLEMRSSKSSFEDSTLQDILVDVARDNSPQIIYLEGKTTVNNITFKNQKGTIYVSKDSKIHGVVNGGEVHHA